VLPQVTQSVYESLGDLNVAIRGYTVGLGGRDVTADEFNFIKSDVAKISGKRASFKYVGLRESTNKVLGVDKALNFGSHTPSGGN
jgi:hypothetical protein